MINNPVLKAIADRRSIRAYTNEQLSEEQLNILLAAAMQAPSARNLQPFHVTVVQDMQLLDKINQSTCTGLKKTMTIKDDYNVFYHAPTVLFLSTDLSPEKQYARHDCGLVSENIALAAHAIGLGTVILGLPREAFTGPDGDTYRKALCFPEGYDFMVAIAVGYPAATKEAHPVAEGLVTIIR